MSAPAVPRRLSVFEVVVGVSGVAGLAFWLGAGPGVLTWPLVVWALVIGAIELVQIPFWRLRISLGFPLLMAVAFLYSPPAAALVAFVSAMDPREFKGEVSPSLALFNRAQIAISMAAASLVFHSVTSLEDAAWRILAGALLAACTDWVINVALVGTAICIEEKRSPFVVLPKFILGNPWEFLVSYFGLGVLGVVMAKLYLEVGFWSIALFVVPLFLARQMFFRSRALEEAHKELQDRERVLARLSNRMAEERQDERIQIANYLHDDLAQLLFQLSLQIDMADRLMREGRTEEAHEVLAEVRKTKEITSDKTRSLINDLHRSPLGRAGLSEAIRSFTEEVGRDTGIRFKVDVTDLTLPPPIQLLVYQIAHEAVMNALKYADASSVEVGFGEKDGAAVLTIHDDGAGFDPEPDGASPEGHFGLTMMRERAQVTGGSFDLVSARGKGTAITVTFPGEWLGQDGSAAAKELAPAEEEDEEPLPFDPSRVTA